MNKNIEPVLTLIRKSSLESLRNHDYVMALIRAFGLTYEKKYPEDYGNDQVYMNPPGVTGVYQTPSQFASYLIKLSYFPISSYCEIGVYQGGTFLFTHAYLSRFNSQFNSVALDITTKYIQNDIRDHFKVTIGTSHILKGKQFDLVLIDADHSYEGVKIDFYNVGIQARICAFHDINNYLCPGTEKFWKEIKSEYEHREFISEDKKVHGIGLIYQL